MLNACVMFAEKTIWLKLIDCALESGKRVAFNVAVCQGKVKNRTCDLSVIAMFTFPIIQRREKENIFEVLFLNIESLRKEHSVDY